MQSDNIQLGGSYDDHPSGSAAPKPGVQDRLSPASVGREDQQLEVANPSGHRRKFMTISGSQLLVVIVLIVFAQVAAVENLWLFFGALAVGAVGIWLAFRKPRRRPHHKGL